MKTIALKLFLWGITSPVDAGDIDNTSHSLTVSQKLPCITLQWNNIVIIVKLRKPSVCWPKWSLTFVSKPQNQKIIAVSLPFGGDTVTVYVLDSRGLSVAILIE